MRNKKVILIICLAVTCVIGCECWLHFTNIDIISAENFWIEEIQISEIPEAFTRQLTGEKVYWDTPPDKDTCDEILSNLNLYKMIAVRYRVNNPSDKTQLKDIRVYPSKADLEIICFNSGNGDFFLYVDPQKQGGFTQNIIVKANGMTDDEILSAFENQSVEFTYYTGNWGDSNGHKLIGSGIHKLSVNVSEIYNGLSTK